MLGGGCSEMLMANAVQNLSLETPGKEAVAMEAFARALRQLPTVIADNGGYDSSELVSQLRAVHHEGKVDYGLDMRNGTVRYLLLWVGDPTPPSRHTIPPDIPTILHRHVQSASPLHTHAHTHIYPNTYSYTHTRAHTHILHTKPSRLASLDLRGNAQNLSQPRKRLCDDSDLAECHPKHKSHDD